MSRRIEIVEVGPRDGLQNEKTLFEIDQKLEMIRRLEAAGARRMEVVSFVNPKRVPQMAGAEEIMAALPHEKGRSRIGLVLNMRGWERCVAAGCDEANVVVCASDGFGIRNQGASVDEQVQAMADIVAARKKEDPPITVTVSVAFGCPFEGEVPTSQIVRIAKHYRDLGSTTVSLGDTTGMATPPIVRAAVRALKAEVPELEIVLHLHNTRGLGLVNAMTGLEEGVTKLDGAIAGLGGCPFAAGATGNVCTEDLVFMLHECGIETGIDLRKLIAVAKRVEQVFGRELPGQLMKSGLRLDLHDMKAVPTAAG